MHVSDASALHIARVHSIVPQATRILGKKLKYFTPLPTSYSKSTCTCGNRSKLQFASTSSAAAEASAARLSSFTEASESWSGKTSAPQLQGRHEKAPGTDHQVCWLLDRKKLRRSELFGRKYCFGKITRNKLKKYFTPLPTSTLNQHAHVATEEKLKFTSISSPAAAEAWAASLSSVTEVSVEE